jgi:hypothetical protein
MIMNVNLFPFGVVFAWGANSLNNTKKGCRQDKETASATPQNHAEIISLSRMTKLMLLNVCSFSRVK